MNKESLIKTIRLKKTAMASKGMWLTPVEIE